MSDELWLVTGLVAIAVGAPLFGWSIIHMARRCMKIDEKGEFDDE